MERLGSSAPAWSPPSLAPLLLLPWLLLAARPARAAPEGDYCSLCEVPGTHTMCVYPSPGPALNCTRYRPAPLSAREKRAIVRTHNLVRRHVANGRAWARASGFGPQPPAADMHQLQWDEELALVAQRWADRCQPFYTTSPHDACRDLPRFPVGQNIVSTAYSTPAASDVRARTLDWYGELAFFDPALVRRFDPVFDPDPKKQIGHYAQMVWGWTYAIGCARVVFQEELPGEQGLWVVERLVCNYAPSGNYLGQPVYTVGAPCSRCPRGTVCSDRYPGLCTAPARAVASGGADDDALQELTSTPEAATERASDEDVVLGGVGALENGTRPPETYKVGYQTEEPADMRKSEGSAADDEDNSEEGAVTEGSPAGEGSDGGDGSADGESNVGGEESEDGESNQRDEGRADGESNNGGEDSAEGEGDEDDEDSADGMSNEKSEGSEDGEDEATGEQDGQDSGSNDGDEDVGYETGDWYDSDKGSGGGPSSEDAKHSGNSGDSEGSARGEGTEDSTFRRAWLFPTSAEPTEKPRLTDQYYYYFYEADRSSL